MVFHSHNCKILLFEYDRVVVSIYMSYQLMRIVNLCKIMNFDSVWCDYIDLLRVLVLDVICLCIFIMM